MVDTKQEVVLLEFTDIESAIYEDLKSTSSGWRNMKFNRKDPIRELCCKLNYEWGNTLEQMREFMLKKKNIDVRDREDQVKKLSEKKELVESKLMRVDLHDWERRSANRFVSEFPKTIAAQKELLKENQRVQSLFERIVRRFTFSN